METAWALINVFDDTFNKLSLVLFLVYNACHKKPCMNGGVCRRKGKLYNCKCKFGYFGNKCQCKLEYFLNTRKWVYLQT